MSKKNTTEARKVKVDRHCPRCGFHGYHFGNVRGIKNRIACCNCSHEWQGRVKREEQDDGLTDTAPAATSLINSSVNV